MFMITMCVMFMINWAGDAVEPMRTKRFNIGNFLLSFRVAKVL